MMERTPVCVGLRGEAAERWGKERDVGVGGRVWGFVRPDSWAGNSVCVCVCVSGLLGLYL